MIKLKIPKIVVLDFKNRIDAKNFARGIFIALQRAHLEDHSDLTEPFQIRGARFCETLKLFCRIEGIDLKVLKQIKIREVKDDKQTNLDECN